MPRIRVEGVSIGCPAAHGEGYCPRCGGGWPGTKSPSAALVRAVERGTLNPQRLGCGPLIEQGEFLVDYFERNGKGGDRQMGSPDILVSIADIGLLDDPDLRSKLLDVELSVGPVGSAMFGMAEGVPYEEVDDPRVDFSMTEIMRSGR